MGMHIRRIGLTALVTAMLAISACGSDDGSKLVKACNDVAAAYDSAMDGIAESDATKLAKGLEHFESLISEYGETLGGDSGATFAAARSKLDAQRPIAESMSEVNKMCVQAGAHAVVDGG